MLINRARTGVGQCGSQTGLGWGALVSGRGNIRCHGTAVGLLINSARSGIVRHGAHVWPGALIDDGRGSVG